MKGLYAGIAGSGHRSILARIGHACDVQEVICGRPYVNRRWAPVGRMALTIS